MEENKCEFCGKYLKSKYTLKTHKLRAKSCLEIQRKNNINVIDDLKKCAYCTKSFASNVFNTHMETCKVKKKNEASNDKEIIRKLKKQLEKKDNIIAQKNCIIAKLEGELNLIKEEYKKDHEFIIEIAKQPKTTNNTINNKILNLTPLDLSTARIKDIIDTEFNHDYGAGGQKGVAEFAKNKLLKDNEGNPTYVCTDFERKVFKYKDEFGEVHKDTKAKKLTSKLVEAGLVNKNKETSEKWWTDEDGDVIKDRHNFMSVKMADVNNIENDNSSFIKELACITVS